MTEGSPEQASDSPEAAILGGILENMHELAARLAADAPAKPRQLVQSRFVPELGTVSWFPLEGNIWVSISKHKEQTVDSVRGVQIECTFTNSNGEWVLDKNLGQHFDISTKDPENHELRNYIDITQDEDGKLNPIETYDKGLTVAEYEDALEFSSQMARHI